MQSQHRIVPDGSRSAQQNRVLGSPGSACWASLFLPPAAKLAVVSWSERHSLPGSLWVRGSFCVFSLKCAAARPAGASWCFLTTWDFMHHAFNKRRQQETRSLSPKLNPHHYLHTHTHTHTHLFRLPDPWIYGLSIKKILLQFGIRPQKPLTTTMTPSIWYLDTCDQSPALLPSTAANFLRTHRGNETTIHIHSLWTRPARVFFFYYYLDLVFPASDDHEVTSLSRYLMHHLNQWLELREQFNLVYLLLTMWMLLNNKHYVCMCSIIPW